MNVQVVEGFKKNEEQLKAYIDEYKNKLSRQDQKYQLLKEHAEEKLEEANKEIDNISKSQVSVIMMIPGGNGAKTFNCNV